MKNKKFKRIANEMGVEPNKWLEIALMNHVEYIGYVAYLVFLEYYKFEKSYEFS